MIILFISLLIKKYRTKKNTTKHVTGAEPLMRITILAAWAYYYSVKIDNIVHVLVIILIGSINYQVGYPY